MNPNIKEIGHVIKQMQVMGASSNAPTFNQAAANIVKQGIEQKREETKYNSQLKDSRKL
jgi:hypothetical protein